MQQTFLGKLMQCRNQLMQLVFLPLLLSAFWVSHANAEVIVEHQQLYRASQSLSDYVAMVLQRNDLSFTLQDQRRLTEMDLESARIPFEMQWKPLSSMDFGGDLQSQTLGLELNKRTVFGTSMALGYVNQKYDSGVSRANDTSRRTYLRLSQGLFRRWGDTYNRSSLTKAELRAEQRNLAIQEQSQQLMLDASQVYYGYVLSLLSIDSSTHSLERAQQSLEAAKARQKIGLVSKMDVYRAELAVLDAQSVLEGQVRNSQRQRELLYEMVGSAPTERLQTASDILALKPGYEDMWLDEGLLENRNDWRAHRLDMEVSRLDLYIAKRDTLPDVSLNVSLQDRAAGSSFDSLSSSHDSRWSVNLTYNYASDQREKRNTLSRQQIQRQQLQRDSATLKRRIYREAREAIEDLQVLEHQRSLSVEKLTQAKNAVELAQIRYHRGLSTNLDVLDALAVLAEAEIRIKRDIADYNLSALRMARSHGVLGLEWIRHAESSGDLALAAIQCCEAD